MTKRYALDMTQGPFLKKILVFSLPLMLTGLLQLLYNTADVVVVGRFAGAQSLAAVGSTGSLVNLMLNVFFGISMGTGVMVARHIGERNPEKIRRCTHTAMSLSIICGIGVGIFGIAMSRTFLSIMKTPDDVIDLAALYLRIFFMGAPGSLVYNFGASILRATGDTRRPLYILTSTGLLNIILNLILVIVFKLGVAGVAVATITAQYVSAVTVVLLLVRAENDCRISLRDLHIYGDEALQIIRIGVPAGIQNSLFSVSNVIIQSTVNSFGAAAIAGTTAGTNYEQFIYTVVNAVSQTSMTFTSQNVGAKKHENINRVYRRCMAIAGAACGIMCVLGALFTRQFVGIFSTDAEVIEIGIARMTLALKTYMFFSLMDVTVGQLRGLGKSFVPTLVSLAGVCGIRIGWVYLFLPRSNTLQYMFLAYPISWIITFFAQLINYLTVTFIDGAKRKKIQREQQNALVVLD